MSNLAQKIDETNSLLRELATSKPTKRETPDPFVPKGPWRDPERLRGSEFLLAIPGVAGILREHFKDVPPEHFELHDDKSRTVTCLCSAKMTIPYGGLHHCACDRIFWNGVTLKAAPPAPEDDVQVCDVCCREVRASQGALALIAGVEGFLCHTCRGES